jgi:UDP:flavonoid glycosyltransferase YjiC (YdhE family)
VARPEARDGRPLTGNVRLTGWVPLGALLASCQGLVQHGGAGSTMTALAHGVPQIVVPEGADTPQSLCADQVEESGTGIQLRAADRARPGALAEAVTELLGRDRYATRARAVRDEIAAMPPPAQVVARLAEIAERGMTEPGIAAPLVPAAHHPAAQIPEPRVAGLG